ncbi:MAG: LamG domain-containing protein [Planctomycetota bacterium]|jgi:hypothetical protein
MKNKLMVLIALSIVSCVVLPVNAVEYEIITLGFEDLGPGQHNLPTDYAGLTWDYRWDYYDYLQWPLDPCSSGPVRLISGSWLDFGEDVTFLGSWLGTFGWGGDKYWLGYNDGQVVYESPHIIADEKKSGWIDVYWPNVDYIKFIGSSGSYAIDDISYIPEPTTLLLLDLEIAGPNEVAEDFQAQYKAVAHYDNGGTADVTASADWFVDDETIASITSGLLTTEPIDLPQDVTITAQYSEGENTESAEREVSIFAICPSGSTLEFDGVDDYVTADIGTTTGNITYSFWFKSGNVGTTKRIVTRNWNSGGSFTSHHANGILWIAYRATDGTQPHLEGGQIVSDIWYHVAFVFNGTHGELYVNGNLKDTSNKLLLPLDSNHLWIGARRYDFNGLIDDVRIYDRALSAEEIGEIMYTRPGVGEDGLVGYWDFDEGEGEIAGDWSGNGNDGTIVGAQWVESDAPIGICTAKGLVERNLLRVFDMKETILELLEDAMGTEDATKGFLDELFESGEMGELKKGDVARAKQKIHSAIQEEEQAATAVDKSIEKLDDALNSLGIE